MKRSALILLFLSVSCGGNGGAEDATPASDASALDGAAQLDAAGFDGRAGFDGFAPVDDAGTGAPVVVEILGEADELVDARRHHYLLLRIERAGHVTFAQWSEPDGGVRSPSPVVVLTKPYDGIDWTGEAVDERWAMRGDGLHPDTDGPGYDPASSGDIVYSLLTPRRVVEDGMLYLLNDIPTLSIFGRFYTGGSPEDDVADMLLGLAYLNERDDVDHERIGVMGGSWGGFEAVYLAARAPVELRPRIVLALYPLTDFALQWRYLDSFASIENETLRDNYETFFEPYRRRIATDTGGGPDEGDYGGLVHGDLVLPTPVLTVHDEHDTLVPFAMASEFAEAFNVRGLYFRHASAPDLEVLAPSHGGDVELHTLSAFTLVTAAFLSELIESDTVLVVGSAGGFAALTSRLLAQRSRGQSLDGTPGFLRGLIETRVQVFDFDRSVLKTGREFVTDGFNAAAGMSYRIDEIDSVIDSLE